MRVDDSTFVHTEDSENTQDEEHNGHKPPSPPSFFSPLADQPTYSDPKHVLEGSAESIVSGTPQSRDPTISTRNSRVVKHVLMAFLAIFIASIVIPQPFFDAPCKFTVVSGYFPACTRGHSREPFATPDFMTLVMLQGRLDQVMEGSASSSKVAVDIKESEMALRDLGTLVKHSTLSSKDALGRDLKHFVDDAKVTSGSLQRFGSRVWGAVDRIVSLNEHTLITLENVPTGQEIAITHRKDIQDIWLQAIDLLDGTLRQLIHEAQENIGSLQRLEERLHTIETMVVVEKRSIQVLEKELKKKWFRGLLGMNEEQHQSNSASLELLEMVKNNRKRALDYVKEVLFSLERISHDLDNLRDGVATPIIIAGSSNIPMESHIKSIRGGTERLVNGQTRMREIEDDYRRRKFSN